MKKILTSLALFAVCAVVAMAQTSFSVSYKKVSDTELDIVFAGKVQSGWHVYSAYLEDGGPMPTEFVLDKATGCRLKGGLKEGPGKKTKYDDIFDMQVGYYENACTFTQRVELMAKDYAIEGALTYQSCLDDGQCMPGTFDFKHSGSDGPVAKAEALKAAEEAKAEVKKEDEAAVEAEVPVVAVGDTTAGKADTAALVQNAEKMAAPNGLWTPVVNELKMLGGDEASVADMAWWYIFILGFLGGLVALCTPCVWPIIPMTVSFFLKRSKDRKRGIRDAVIYGISIIVIYVTIGLLITSIFGASALNDLSTNAIFNVFFFLMLIVFAASFFGGFEITLPASWGAAVDSKAERTTGLLSIFLMAFTLSLVSFSCTGPIIGFLLVEASTSSGSILAPTIGMFGFALALALPFTLFALFPAWLKSAPKSGGWLNIVKVSLGFLELAFALKFLSVADLAYGMRILDRETFLALWIVIFTLLGLYLLGKIKFPHDDDDIERVSVPRFFAALCSLAFAVYMVPGLWGAPLNAVSAFSPPISTQSFNLNPVKVEAAFTDYDAGMDYARKTGKPIIVDFTGHGCVNCRQMEMGVWHDERVRTRLTDDYVLISLYVDDKTRLPETQTVVEDGRETKLRTIGDKWSYLQRTKFGANAQPFYVILNNEGHPLLPAYTFDMDVEKFVNYLKKGTEKFKAEKK